MLTTNDYDHKASQEAADRLMERLPIIDLLAPSLTIEEFMIGYEGIKTAAQLAEDLDKTRQSFAAKMDYLRSGVMIETEELDVREFVWWIFDRDTRFDRDVQPFEAQQSPEYKMWREQKRAGAETIDYTGYGCWRYNPVVFYKDYTKMTAIEGGGEKPGNKHRLLLLDDDDTLDWLGNRKFALLSPVTYVGRNNTAQNARYLYAFAVDLDGVGMAELRRLFVYITRGIIPAPNIITNSGHGLHLYYLLQKPVALYKDNIRLLNKMKKGLTNVVWMSGLTSNLKDKQYQGVLQGFRVPGTLTKFGEVIKSFRLPDAPIYNLEDINELLEENKLTPSELASLADHPVYNPAGVTALEAQRLWPEWYVAKVIKKQQVARKWHIKRDLYDWWLARIQKQGEHTEVKYHHRYWCVLALITYAVKCDIPRDEVLRDALSLVSLFDAMTDDDDNHFTPQDVEDAMQAYDEKYCTWPIHTIASTTGLAIDKSRRNGRRQSVHLGRIRAMQMYDDPDGHWRDTAGRKTEADKVIRWQQEHPGLTNKAQCARDTGLSRTTVTKWWLN